MLLFYIRHGDPCYHPDSLTPIGRRQAEAVARRLARFGVDKIYASSAVRAQETAQPTAELTRREIITLDWCHENHAKADMMLPTESGKPDWCFYIPEIERMLRSPEVQALGDRWYEYPGFPENRFKEGIERVDREVDAWLESLGYKHDRESKYYTAINPNEERVALFAHHGFGMLFFSSVLDIPYPMFATRFEQSFTGFSVIRFPEKGERVYPRLLELSCDAHLYRHDLPTNYNRGIRF